MTIPGKHVAKNIVFACPNSEMGIRETKHKHGGASPLVSVWWDHLFGSALTDKSPDFASVRLVDCIAASAVSIYLSLWSLRGVVPWNNLTNPPDDII